MAVFNQEKELQKLDYELEKTESTRKSQTWSAVEIVDTTQKILPR